jgi:hypothetical protein
MATRGVNCNIEKLKDDYLASGYKPEFVAAKVGVTVETFHSYFRKRCKLSMPVLILMSQLFGKNIHYYMEN